jgi:hypothetical protein
MNSHERIFKSVVAATLQRLNEPFGKFQREFRLNELYRDLFHDDDGVPETAAKALFHFCADDDGTFNGNCPGLICVTNFLDKVTTAPPRGARLVECANDLKNGLISEERVRQWVRNWYTV